MRILLIEDDSVTAHCIQLALKLENFRTDRTHLGANGIALTKMNDYDIILLNLVLPDISGLEVLRSLRLSNVKTPVLIMSRQSSIDDKVTAFGCGADDYMIKPFHRDELVARIRAIVRRSKGVAQSIVSTGDLCVNLNTKMVQLNGSPIHLTRKEYQMLEFLSVRKGSTLSKAMLLDNLYGGMDEPTNKIIDVFISKLRKKLANAANGKDYIETVRGQSYVLREPSGREESRKF